MLQLALVEIFVTRMLVCRLFAIANVVSMSVRLFVQCRYGVKTQNGLTSKNRRTFSQSRRTIILLFEPNRC